MYNNRKGKKGGENLKGSIKYVKIKSTDSSNEGHELRAKFTEKKVRRRRKTGITESGRKSDRVMSPLESNEKNKELYSNLGIVSVSTHKQMLRSKRLKARRTLTLAPAPVPVNAPKSGIERLYSEIKKEIVAHIKKLDIVFLCLVALIGIFGIIAVHSATLTEASHRRYDFLQIAGFLMGIFAVVVLPFIDYTEITKRTKLIFILNVVILIYTAIFGISVTGSTNRNWVSFFGITNIQPAEISKVLFIVSLASHLEILRDSINKIKGLLTVCVHALVIIGLVALQSDVGNLLVFVAIFVTMLFVAKIEYKYILASVAVAVISFPIIWENLGDFRRKRILIGFNPDLDPLDVGHQVIQSRNAIASGGFLGQGYMQGATIQRKGALFAKHTDMIFAVIGQEFGFVGCVIFILCYAFLTLKIISIAGKAKDSVGTYICAGVAGLFIFQFIVNIGMAVGLTPTIGITLPLVSYGTSSLLSAYFALALVMSVHSNSKNYSYKTR